MKGLNVYTLAICGLFWGAIANSAQGFTLDLFKDVSSDPGFNAGVQTVEEIWDDTASSQSGSSSVSGLSGVQWGKRTLNLTIESNDPFISLISGDGGRLRVVTNGTSTGFADLATASTIIASGSIEWDGWDGTTADLVNLEADNQNAFNLEVISLDQGVTLNFKVTDKDDNVATISEEITNSIVGESVIFEYQDAPEYNTVDFTEVKHIALEIVNPHNPPMNPGTAALDFKFDFVETIDTTIPFEFSPSLGLIIGGSFFGLNIWRQKRKTPKSKTLTVT